MGESLCNTHKVLIFYRPTYVVLEVIEQIGRLHMYRGLYLYSVLAICSIPCAMYYMCWSIAALTYSVAMTRKPLQCACPVGM